MNNKTKKNIINFIKKYKLILIIICIILFLYYRYYKYINSPDYYKVSDGLRNLVDENNNISNIVLLNYPFDIDKKYKNYLEAKSKGALFIGCSSFINFPCITKNKYDVTKNKDNNSWKYNYFDLCFGWFHCFRNPDKCIPKDYPKALISESDFVRYEGYKYNKDAKKEYDFIYVCLKDNDKCKNGWQSENRNWELGKKCIKIMCEKFNMKGLLVGRINCDLHPSCHKLLKVTDKLNYHKFIKQYEKCKFIFVPNILDASPRVLTEALCFNIPCLVNKNIIGGWKYVNDKTGMFFNDEHDFENVLTQFLDNLKNYTPRDYFINNHGPKYEGKEIIKFIKKNIPDYKSKVNLDLDKIKFLRPTV